MQDANVWSTRVLFPIIDENFPHEPFPEKRDPYCLGKLWAEKLILDFMNEHPSTTIIVLRPGIVYGEGKIPIIRPASRPGGIHIYKGSRRRLLPLVYMDNLIEALLLSGRSPVSGIFNVVDRERVSIGSFLNLYRELTGKGGIHVFVPLPILRSYYRFLGCLGYSVPESRAYNLNSFRATVIHSTKRIETQMGWKQKVSFTQGLERTLRNSSLKDRSCPDGQ